MSEDILNKNLEKHQHHIHAAANNLKKLSFGKPFIRVLLIGYCYFFT